MLRPDETAALILAALDRHGIPHMLTGSHASSYHGRPRQTNDIDLVIAPSTLRSLLEMVGALPEARFYARSEAAAEAFDRLGMFDLIDLETGAKVDLILRKNQAFSESEFSRRQRARIFGVDVWVATLEDTILAKLEWAKAGESERQLRDVLGMLEIAEADLDSSYIARWAHELGVEALWDRVQREARASGPSS